jgi:hypothetical protein
MFENELLYFFHDAGSLNKQKKIVRPAGSGGVLVLNMRVKVGSRIRFVFASRTRQPFNDADGTTLGRRFGLGAERYQDSHNPE